MAVKNDKEKKKKAAGSTSSKDKVVRTAKPVLATPATEKTTAGKAPAEPAKPAKSTRARKPAAKPAPEAQPPVTNEEIQLRAYFISEQRQRAGIPGDPHSDWLEAERQILAERMAAGKKRTASRKKAVAD